ncbi:MAG: carbohydrate ABC transporter substrate-binding protein, partial [Clostridiales bacterium]|nr:carbohydrate ABC transporter substrate-binding protein [Clostridiales bacterium]
MRKLMTLALAALFALSLAVTPALAETPVEISVFQLKVEIDPMIQAFGKLYNEKHPGVTVTVETLG